MPKQHDRPALEAAIQTIQGSEGVQLKPDLDVRPIKSEEGLKGRLEYMFKPINLLEAYRSGWLQVEEPERELACQLNSNLREFVDALHEVGKDRRRIRCKGNLHSHHKQHLGVPESERRQFAEYVDSLESGDYGS